MNELMIPQQAADDPMARELVRVWAAGGRQQITLLTGLWEDPAAWGLLLVDLARHVAIAYQEEGWSEQEVLDRIRSAFDAEWDAPTDEPTGGTID